MRTNASTIKSWCGAGAAFITLLGFVWHYLYDLSGENNILGAIVPVNESVWEHLKLGYWGLLLFSVVEYFFIRCKVNNYYLAKLTGLLVLEDCILLVHYTYLALSGHISIGIDIASFVMAVVLCQYAACTIYRAPAGSRRRERLAVAAWAALGILLVITTYFPPRYEIFRDRNTNAFGIEKRTASSE
ncbi:MAG TPA: DUF6512 family protein [Chitinophagaceae bacterium]